MTSRTRRRTATASRAAQAHQAQRLRARRRVLMVASLTALVLVVSAGVAAAVIAGRNPGPPATTAPSLAAVRTFTEQRNHVEGRVTYPQSPPAGGLHNPVWLNCGIYTSPVPNENAVHDLEHGAVWITYRPDLASADVATLQQLVRGRTYLLLSPYPGLPAPVVASAWGKQLALTGAHDPPLAAFIAAFRLGPQAPERGSPCSGGLGTPSS